MSISAIYCVDKNGLLGLKDDHFYQPVDCPEDKKYFLQVTKGKSIVMGGNTARSLVYEVGGLLPNRTHIVLTKDEDLKLQLNYYATVDPDLNIKMKYFSDIRSLRQYLQGQDDEMFVIGGANLIEQLEDIIETWYVTEFDVEVTFAEDQTPIYIEQIGSCKEGHVREGFERVECKKFAGVDNNMGEDIVGYFGVYRQC